MRLIKSINNNAALGLDSAGREIVVFGKGIGTAEMPCALTDLTRISRTFYGIGAQHLGLLNEIPEKTFHLASKIVDYAVDYVDDVLNPNLAFTLADHIQFAVERHRQNMHVGIPRSYELEMAFPRYFEVAEYALKTIERHLEVHLPKQEKTSIALHFINARQGTREAGDEALGQRVLDGAREIIEGFYQTQLNRDGFAYFRFENHMMRFVQRKTVGDEIDDNTSSLFESLVKEQPQTYECVKLLDDFLLEIFGSRCTKQELVYLMVHVDAVCAKAGGQPGKL